MTQGQSSEVEYIHVNILLRMYGKTLTQDFRNLLEQDTINIYNSSLNVRPEFHKMTILNLELEEWGFPPSLSMLAS